jgi:hypothetical protein
MRTVLAVVVTGALLVASVAAVACSSFGDEAPSGDDASFTEAASDGSTVDALVSPDAGADAVDAACPAFATFCDDFEIGDLRRWGPENVTPPSSLVIDDSGPPHRGAYGLHFATKENRDGGVIVYTGGASIQSNPFPAVSAGTIAVRFYVKGPTLPSDGTSLVWLTKAPSDQAELILATSYGAWRVEALAGSLGATKVATSNVAFAPGKWLCVEWVVDVGTAGRQQLFIDGNPAPVVTAAMDTIGDATHGYERAMIAVNNQGEATQELFFDDFVVAVLPARADGPRIGCIP